MCVSASLKLVSSEGSIVVVAGMRITSDRFSLALGPSVANGLLLQ